MSDIVRASVAMALNIVLPLGVQFWDKRHRSASFRSQWSTATWGASLYAFGSFSMLGWMWVTRPRWWRVLWGWLSCLGLHLALGIVDLALQHRSGKTITAEDNLGALLLISMIMSVTLFMELIVSLWTRMGRGRWAR